MLSQPREEQAEPDGLEHAELAGFMLGMSGSDYTKALCYGFMIKVNEI